MCDIESVVRGYREAARGTAFSVPAPKANEFGRQLHAHYVVLRQTQAGRDAITALMSDDDPSVRLWAARHSLEWTPDVAQAALEQLCGIDGLMGFTAEMTIKEYQKGRLRFGPAAGGTAEA